jgi:uncharacterized protein (DUF924 family)
MDDSTHTQERVRPDPLLQYWFGADQNDAVAFAQRKKTWFTGGPAVDKEITDAYSKLLEAAGGGALGDWEDSSRGRLALILLFDQFPRNIFRGSRTAFAYDAPAFALAESGIELKLDRDLTLLERLFFYMPYQHSESLQVQKRSVQLFESLARQEAAKHIAETLRGFAQYARQHAEIVARFGRFPHRNRLLGRPSTPEEEHFLRDGGPTFGQ